MKLKTVTITVRYSDGTEYTFSQVVISESNTDLSVDTLQRAGLEVLKVEEKENG